MLFIVYFVLYISLIILASSATKSSIRARNNIWNHSSYYYLLFTFSFIVGTRYMVGLDYPDYMDIVLFGAKHHYYEHVELIPRTIVDVVNGLKLDFYWWFILMAFLQIYFLTRTVRGELLKLFPWIILCFLLLYLTFYMNVVRQGAALSCYLCAVSYAKDRKLWWYLFFIILGFCCHSSIIIWTPTYWLFNRELFPSIKIQFLLLILSSFLLSHIIKLGLEYTRPYWVLFGYGYQAENLVGNESHVILGSGLGLLVRYFRWSVIIFYYNKMKRFYGTKEFILFYNIFFIGICFDYSTMFNTFIARVFMYGTFIEVIVLAFLFNYLNQSKKFFDKILLVSLLILLFTLLLYSMISGGLEWQFIWNR